MDVSLQDVLGMPFIQNSNFGHLKDASMLNSLNNKRKAITNANFVDLTSSDDHSEHSESSFIQDVSLPSQVAFKSGRKRRKIDSPHEGKLTVTAVNAERIREKKRIQHSVVNNELPFFNMDAGSSSYKHTQSFCNSDESYDCTHTCLQKEEPKSLSQSRSTPIFYGDESEGNSFAKSMEFHDTKQNEDQERSSTKTFYGNTTDNSRHSSSTAVFYGSYADEAHLSMAEDPLDLRRSLESNMNIHDHVCVCAKVPYDHDTVDEANSISAADSKIRDPAQCCHEFDDNSQCFCNIVQISSDHSQSVCRGCNSLMMDDKKLIITPTSSEGESHKETRVVVSNSSSCRKGQDGLECQSESQPMYKHAMSMKVHEEVQQKQNRKLNLMPSAKKRVWKNAGSVCSQARQTHCQNRASRLSIALGKERNLNDLFDAILRRVRELRHVRMVAPSGDQFASTEEILNQVPWDPIIFHSIPNVHRCGLKDPDPLTDIWRDMELAFHEVNGVAALAKKEGTFSEDKVLACDHNLVLSELEGHICAHCGLLVTSVENILAPVLQGENYKSRDSRIELVKGLSATCTNNDEHQKMPRAPFETDLEAAWQLIKELKPLLQKHQVDGFNFLWKNVGALSRQTNKEGGGCIIAHAPGTGKSLLIISFLKSFLHLHSWCRPLIVAPKNMLLSWKNEFEKWKAGVKVYLLQASSPLTYLSTISEWQKNTSVLIINYHLFSHLVDERRLCKTFNVQRIGSLLLHIPDILVLDEGHVPRNCSKLRESLLQIRTRFKILVSGTWFHNNVQELFNLLYLARPNFLSQLPMRHINTRFDGIDIDNYNNAKQWQTFEDFTNKDGQVQVMIKWS